jgi:hypothetical protein
VSCPPLIEPEELREVLLRLLRGPDSDAAIAAALLIVEHGLVRQSNGAVRWNVVTPLPPSVPFPTGRN